MTPSSEKFLLDVRQAVRLARQPAVAIDSDLLDGDRLTDTFQRALLWLTPKCVEHYVPDDFADLPKDIREELDRAVAEFREAAAAVSPDEPATTKQGERGIEAFRWLVHSVRHAVVPEWREAAERVVQEAETWSAEWEWRTRRDTKEIRETLLGRYELPQLLVYAEQDLYVISPIARFLPGAKGAFDIAIQPSFSITSLYRDFDDRWYLHLGPGPSEGHREPWTRESFKASVEELKAAL
ncbi:MAG: hypothetical protein WD066_11820 [Planctomycetaceae bacterium]